MTARQGYVIFCDAPDCYARFSCDRPRADETRGQASLEGWVHGVEPLAPRRGGPARSLDYCAAHAAQCAGLRPRTLPRHARERVQ